MLRSLRTNRSEIVTPTSDDLVRPERTRMRLYICASDLVASSSIDKTHLASQRRQPACADLLRSDTPNNSECSTGSRQGRRLAAALTAALALFGCSAFAPTACKAPVAVAHRYARGSSQPPRTPPAKASRSPRTFSQGTPTVAALRQAYARLAAGRIRSSEHSSCSAARVPHGTGQPGNTQPDQLSPGYHHIPNRYQHQA